MKDKYKDSETPRLDHFLDKLDEVLIREIGEGWDYTFDIEDGWIHISLHCINPDENPKPLRLIDIYG